MLRLGGSAAPLALAWLGIVSITVDSNAQSRWTIADRPLLAIGAEGSDSLHELMWAESAIRLANGEIVVANRRSWELRWFDASGRFVRTVGRRGKGPGEFGRSIYVFDDGHDTIVVHDADNRRFHYVDGSGAFARLDTTGAAYRELWVYDRAVLARLPASADRERVRRALRSIPGASHDDIRLVLVDQAGNLWVRSLTKPDAVVVYDSAARPIGALEIPARFEVYQAFDTLVLGRFRDEQDVEQIQLRHLTRIHGARDARGARGAGPARERPPYDEVAELRARAAIVGQMRASARNVLTAQELFFVRQKRYARTIRELGAPVPPRVTLTLLGATGTSYVVLAEHPDTPVVCLVGVGRGLPFGFVDGCG